MPKIAMLTGTGCALAAFLLLASSARAEVIVLDSTVPAIKTGAKLKDDTILKLPEGAKVRVLIKSQGKNATKTINGPYEGVAADYKDSRSWWDRLTGKPQDNDKPITSTRGPSR